MNKYARAIDAGEFVDGVVCQDCLFGIANGEWPELGVDAHMDWTLERERESDRVMSEYDVTLGHVTTGPFAKHEDKCDDDRECQRAEFSWRKCDVCGTTLAGERHDVIMVQRSALEESEIGK